MTGLGCGGIARSGAVGTLSPTTGVVMCTMSMEGAHLKMCPREGPLPMLWMCTNSCAGSIGFRGAGNSGWAVSFTIWALSLLISICDHQISSDCIDHDC
uniref:Uncharacterized protein n=1 Tax=Romanomermis culicivorax TaxID=13658 RepID=A0A915I9X0_ROMCU